MTAKGVTGLNLLPNQAKFQMSKMKLRQQVKKTCLTAGLLWLLVAMIIFLYWGWLSLRLSNAEKELKRADNQYSSLTETAVTSLQLKYRAKIVGELLEKRFEYSRTLEMVDSLFDDSVALSDFSLDGSNKILLEGETVGMKAMDQIENKIKMINSEEIEGLKSARINGLMFKGGVWQFKMEVEIK